MIKKRIKGLLYNRFKRYFFIVSYILSPLLYFLESSVKKEDL